MGSSINKIKFLSPKFFGVRNLNTTPVYDADALAYFTANTAITSTADKNAINTFYLGLKSDGIYTKIKAMYLPIWGSAASSKWNLVNPVDSDAAFRLTFSTGWTFSSSGMTPLNAYADTFFIPALQINSSTYSHASYYSRTDSPITSDVVMGSYNSVGVFGMYMLYSRKDYMGYHQDFPSGITYRAADISGTFNTKGFTVGSLNSSTAKLYKNNSLVASNTQAIIPTAIVSNLKTFIGCADINSTAGAFTDKQCSFASIGQYLTDTEATNFYSRVQTLMTYFGINV